MTVLMHDNEEHGLSVETGSGDMFCPLCKNLVLQNDLLLRMGGDAEPKAEEISRTFLFQEKNPSTNYNRTTLSSL